MLEWVCPRCGRQVDPSVNLCPFCGYTEAPAPAPAAESKAPAVGPVRRLRRRRPPPFNWGDVDRGFRFGLGFIAALAAAYFVLFLIAYFGGYPDWVDLLARWLRSR